jgi:hypothetical protein
MKLPRSVVINGQRWRVVRKPLHKRERGLMGQCCRSLLEIQLDTTLTGTDLIDTFLHEVLHACLGRGWDEVLEESIVRTVTPKLLEALQGMGWAPCVK